MSDTVCVNCVCTHGSPLNHIVFDDGDERTLKRSSLCLKGGRHYHESEVGLLALVLHILHYMCLSLLNTQSLDKMPLTDPENFGTPVLFQVRRDAPIDI